MNAAFGRKMPAAGNLAFLSQSGALCTSVLDYAEERQMGFSKFISFGNKADVNEIDLLDYLAKDEKTSVIAMYLEDVTNGRRFIETVRDIFWETHKPMLCLKSGRSPEGAKAVSSHTGSLAGSDSVYDALLIQSGVQRVDTIAELFDYAALYTTQPLPRGDRVAIITNAGGPGIMATDAAVRHGLKLAELSEATKEKLAAVAARHRLAAQPDRRDRRRPRRPLQGRGPHRAGRRERRHGHRDPHAAVDDRHRRDGRRRARGRQGHRQAGGLLVHGGQGRGAGREDSPRGGRSQLRLPRGRREEPGGRQLAGRLARNPPPRDARLQRPRRRRGQARSWPSCWTIIRSATSRRPTAARCWPATACRC